MPEVGLYGRKPALIPAQVRDLTYYVAGTLPKPPAKVSVPAVADWGMDGNDQYGDCGVAGFAHGTSAVASLLHNQGFKAANATQCVQYYMKYDHNVDEGVVLSEFLKYVEQNKFFNTTLAAYAPVTINDIPTLQFAINAYGFAYVGINVTQAMEQAFGEGQPWTAETLNSPIAGGHCIILAGYDSQYIYGVTWGSVVKIAYPTWHGMADEAWAVILGEQVSAGGDGRGVNLAALKADISKLNV